MKTNAISVANYLIEKAESIRGNKVNLIELVKFVYFVHGFSLAILRKPAIDSRFDKVEAWKYGPIIPSVYHTFLYNGTNPISEKGIILDKDKETGKFISVTPELEDEDIKKICDMVLRRYKGMAPDQIVELTHRENSPWGVTYKEGRNLPIEDWKTKLYYQMIVEDATEA